MSLTDLDNHTCRWPIGDPKDDNFHFCGKKVRIGQTYCEEHAAVAYVKPSKK
ncbi:MAG: GcrA family cell cycle regulator [Alphaproteobacteria bacterium]